MVTVEFLVRFLHDVMNGVNENAPCEKPYGRRDHAAWALGVLGSAAQRAVPDLFANFEKAESDDMKVACLSALRHIVLEPPNMLDQSVSSDSDRLAVVRLATPCLIGGSMALQTEAALTMLCAESDAIHAMSEIVAALEVATIETAGVLARALSNIGPDAKSHIPALTRAYESRRMGKDDYDWAVTLMMNPEMPIVIADEEMVSQLEEEHPGVLDQMIKEKQDATGESEFVLDGDEETPDEGDPEAEAEADDEI